MVHASTAGPVHVYLGCSLDRLGIHITPFASLKAYRTALLCSAYSVILIAPVRAMRNVCSSWSFILTPTSDFDTPYGCQRFAGHAPWCPRFLDTYIETGAINDCCATVTNSSSSIKTANNVYNSLG